MSNPTFLLPIWNGAQFFDNNGAVLAGGLIYQYEGGSYTVQQTTYSGDTNATSANPNPIVLDADGRIPVQMWGQEGLYYNLLLTDSNNNTLDAQPMIIGSAPSSVPTNGSGVNVWNQSATPTYVASNQFVVPGSVTGDYAVGNRVQFVNGGSVYGYGTVTAVVFSSPNTHVTIEPDSTAIGSNLTAVYWSSLVANAITVDAAGVSYASDVGYTNLKTVGGQIAQLDSEVSGILTGRVTPGAYAQANVAVNEYGIVTAIESGLPLTTKGDLEVFTTQPARLPVGADGTVLTADSTQTGGVNWLPPFGSTLVNAATTNLVRTGSSGVVADPALTCALAAGHIYQFTIVAYMFSPTAGVFQGVGYTGTSHQGAYTGYYGPGPSQGGGAVNGTESINTNLLYASGIDQPSLIYYTGIIYTNSSGNLYLTWGNAGAGSNAMTRYAASSINVVQVG